MPNKDISAAAEDLAEYFKTGYLPVNGHATSIAALVFEQLPNGELAWLKPCTEPAEDDDALYTITWEGRRALRMAELFGTEG